MKELYLLVQRSLTNVSLNVSIHKLFKWFGKIQQLVNLKVVSSKKLFPPDECSPVWRFV